ncbi:MAG TPA: SprB repeat-containing protein [Bacteroidia bacterium]|nr:SprB repeat-containing protein [Bacteroidia bacterium]
MQATLQASSYNGYNISCYGMQDGTLAVNISNGTAPYNYTWSNGDTLATVSSLAAGYYAVRVRDAAGGDTTLQITLTQPEQLAIAEMTPYYYANDFNVSTYGACNGSVTTLINGGVLPLTYHWEPGQQNILAPSNLCGRENTLTVTDLNGCKASSSINLKEPQRDDWTMTGNWGSNATDNFIGTNDNKDLVFKTNNSERLRLLGNGDIKINSFTGTGNRILTSDANGKLIPGPIVVNPTQSCTDPYTFAWQIKTNILPNIAYTCWNQVGIGTDDPQKNLGVKGGTRFFNFNDHTKYLDVEHDGANASINSTDNVLINYYSGKNIYLNTGTTKGDVETGGNTFLATATGRVGIGSTSPSQALEITHSDQYGGIAINQVSNQYYTSEIKFNYQGVQKWATGCYLGSINNQSYFIWNHGLAIQRTAFFIDGTSNNTGIDTDVPTAKLDVNGDLRVRSLSGNNGKLIELDANGNLVASNIASGNAGLWATDANGIYNIGKVFVGFNNCSDCSISPYKLYVEGGIMTRDVKVTALPFPDYVFAKDYKLMSIYELEEYLQLNKHLPEIPSAKEIESNDGFELGDMQTKLLKKVEEQTLYIISLQKQVDELKELVYRTKK